MKGFNSLELFFKESFVNENGSFLICTRHFNHVVSLYGWDKYLIEKYFDREQKKTTVIKLASFQDLDKYLKEIRFYKHGLIVR